MLVVEFPNGRTPLDIALELADQPLDWFLAQPAILLLQAQGLDPKQELPELYEEVEEREWPMSKEEQEMFEEEMRFEEEMYC